MELDANLELKIVLKVLRNTVMMVQIGSVPNVSLGIMRLMANVMNVVKMKSLNLMMEL